VNTHRASFVLVIVLASTGCPSAMAQEKADLNPVQVRADLSPFYDPEPVCLVPQGWVPPPATVPAPTKGMQGAEIPGYPDQGLSSAPQFPDRAIPLQATWDNGLRLESENKQFSVHVGGLGQIDSVYPIGPQSQFAAPGGGSNGVGNAQATFLRRAILQADGSIWDQFDFMVQFDFANASNENDGLQPPSFGNLTSSPAPLNVWMQVRDVPYLGTVRVGNQAKPIGMTNNTPAAFLSFMERPDNNDAFYGPFDNGFALGISVLNWAESERLTWRFGVFQPATNVFGVALNKYTVGARITALPWYEDEGRQLVHLGLGYWGGEIVQNELRDRVRPLLRNAPGFAVPVLADTKEIPADKQYTIGPELALVAGPFTVQAEYAGQFLTHAMASNGQDQGAVFFHGGYVEALCFLSGEYQPYERREGVFGRVVPIHDLHWSKKDCCCQGCGAWQIGVRLSYIDLNDKAIQGGRVFDWTVGLNWYLNPNMKAQLNYIAERRFDTPGVPEGWINGIGLRASYDF
jgi:phosphate-selective porin OprO/OprP